MILLSTSRSSSSGLSIELTCRGRNKRVSIRGWFPHENTIHPLHFTLEELANALGLLMPPAKPRGKNRI